jgi:hypothetical protein
VTSGTIVSGSPRMIQISGVIRHPQFPGARSRAKGWIRLEIGVGKGTRPPLPPNRASGSPAHGSPVESSHIGIDRATQYDADETHTMQ